VAGYVRTHLVAGLRGATEVTLSPL
jgi:hypothetical protein